MSHKIVRIGLNSSLGVFQRLVHIVQLFVNMGDRLNDVSVLWIEFEGTSELGQRSFEILLNEFAHTRFVEVQTRLIGHDETIPFSIKTTNYVKNKAGVTRLSNLAFDRLELQNAGKYLIGIEGAINPIQDPQLFIVVDDGLGQLMVNFQPFLDDILMIVVSLSQP